MVFKFLKRKLSCLKLMDLVTSKCINVKTNSVWCEEKLMPKILRFEWERLESPTKKELEKLMDTLQKLNARLENLEK